MISWSRTEVPRLPGLGHVPRIWDTASAGLVEARPAAIAGLYVCGITPYDATHIGHAATYIAYDTLIRVWLDAGFEVTYVQNTTDVDDPLLERADAAGIDWRDLAATQTERYRRDMEALGVIPPDHFIAVTEKIDDIAAAVRDLLDRNIAYSIDGDIYFDSAAAEAVSTWHLGDESHFDRSTMLVLSAERGGDPERVGKRDALDPLLWRGAREAEPSWDSVVGPGRPGWHIECSIIAADYLPLPVTVKGGGADLIFPHHEFSAGHTAALTGESLASMYSHAGLVSYQGSKMSKSLGNLVLIDGLVENGADPRAIRLAILAMHYRADWAWTDDLIQEAADRLDRWEAWATTATDGDSTSLVAELRTALADDLDAPAAVAAVDLRAASGNSATSDDLDAIDALLGIRL